MKIKFIRRKGSCPEGHIGDYSQESAERLIKLGYAVEYKEPKKVLKQNVEKKILTQIKGNRESNHVK